MTKREFLETLGKILNRELSEAEVQDNLRYYENYIRQETANGKTEEQVLSELGDPRLIARTILQVDAQKENTFGREAVFTEEEDGGYSHSYKEESRTTGSGFHVHSFGGIKAWLILIAVAVVLFILLKTAFTLFIKLLPVLVIIAAAMWIKHKFFE